MTHELTLNQQEEEEVKKKKFNALVAEIREESSDEDKSELEVAFLTRNIKNFMRKKKSVPRKRVIGEVEKEKERETLIYFEYKK